jgi:DNA polymerase-3 subunit delta'
VIREHISFFSGKKLPFPKPSKPGYNGAVMNWNLLGHEWAVSLLKEHVAHNRLRHAYLVAGPPGIGRRTLALHLAQALNCPQPVAPGEPCGACLTCQQIERMQYPDLTVTQAEQRGGTLRVDQVRELQHSLSLAPYSGLYRVALLLHFEEARASAQNALLKTLEEPAPQVVLALTAESPEALLPTIVSRCEVLRLRPLKVDLVSAGLQERWGVPAEQAVLLAHISGGRPGYALRLYQQPELLEQRQAWLEALQQMLGASRVQKFAFADSIYKDKDSARLLLLTWLTFWRDVLLRASGAAAPLTNPDWSSAIEAAAGRYGLQAAHGAAAAVERTLGCLEGNVNTRLALEVLLLDLPHG